MDERYCKPDKTYYAEDAIEKNLNDMIKESEYFSNIFKTEFNKPLVLTEKDRKDFNNSTKC